jgi:hypothetical protein
MPDYIANDLQYKTIQGDMWDMVALREYGDEHAMHFIQDANFDQRFTDAFPGSVILDIPPVVTVQYNLKSGSQLPSIKDLLPWR